MSLFRFEHKSAPMAGRAVFAGRITANLMAAIALMGAALALGMIGYRASEHMAWLDAFLNAAMLLGGMGPVDTLHTDEGKLFAGCYALLCGLVIVAATAVILAPVLHRVLHAIHVDDAQS